MRSLASLFLACLALCASAAEPSKLSTLLQAYVDDHSLAGAVALVADDEKVLATEAVGWMDVAARKPMRPDALFWIASQSKPITAAALMILVDEGKVSVDDPVEKYLPEFKGQLVNLSLDPARPEFKVPRHPILVREILSHTSGLPFKSDIEEPTLDIRPLSTRVQSYAKMSLLFEPGSKSKYSNAGINTAGRIIEVVSGMRFEKFLEARLFKPLGMKDTSFLPAPEQLSRLAKSYKPNARKDGLEECEINQLKYPLSDASREPMPAGGLFSTAADLAVFYQMVANDGAYKGTRILSALSVRQMTSDQSGEAKSAYGFGFGTNGRSFTHGGAFNSMTRYDRETKLITVFLGQHAGWIKDGKTIISSFQKSATATYGSPTAKPMAVSAGNDAHLNIGLANPAELKTAAPLPTAATLTQKNLTVFQEAGRYGGWPANHGLWQWGDEIVAGFEVAWYKHPVNDHAVDRSKPFENWQARSLDGGKTWKMEHDLPFTPLGKEKPPQPLPAPFDFTAPDSALMFRFGGLHLGPSWFYTTKDRCKTWQGPYQFAVDGIERICTRTDLVILGPHDCLMFGSAAKSDGKEGRVFCARTTDGGLNWKLVSLIGPEPEKGYAIMPSTVRLPTGALITTIRQGGAKLNSIAVWRSDDLGRTWTYLGEATGDIGGNPPALVQLQDGRLCLSYGYRRKPFGARARISEDAGRSWGPEMILRDDGLTGDLGYPRSIVRPDGKVLTIYYFNGPRDEDRTIQGTLFTPYAPAIAAKSVTIQPSPPKPIVSVTPAPTWPTVVDRVRFLAAPDRERFMVGGKISGSNISRSEGFVTLAEIKEQPAKGQWGEIRLTHAAPYRWIRYEAPPGSHGNIAELEFYTGMNKIKAGGFGSAGFMRPGIHWKGAFDGKPETWFNSNNADGQFVGLDLGNLASAWQPDITPNGGDHAQSVEVRMTSRTPGASIRYTLDGTTPGPNDGRPYDAPFTLGKNATLVAVSFKDGLAPSPPSTAVLRVGASTRPASRSFHIGNSLTGNASRYTGFIRTAGGEDKFPAYLIGGSLTFKLWEESQGADRKRWGETYAKAEHPLEVFTLQPRDFDIAREADHAIRFIRLIREKSPDVQPWLYAEWVEMERRRPSDKGEVPSYQMKKTFPALTWQESMGAMVLYNEEVQHRVLASYHDGKPVRIIPTALALGWARTLVDAGKLPGIEPGEAGFYAAFFEDHVHVNAAGCYLVACTWYAALHRESPEGKMLPVGTGLNAAQAGVIQRLAWDIVRNYPDCGLYEAGTQPCAKPGIVDAGKHITLTCATPGAFFRYTLDGTTPTRTTGYIYNGIISVQPGIRLQAVAYRSGLADSEVAELPPVTPAMIPAK